MCNGQRAEKRGRITEGKIEDEDRGKETYKNKGRQQKSEVKRKGSRRMDVWGQKGQRCELLTPVTKCLG